MRPPPQRGGRVVRGDARARPFLVRA